MCNQSNYHDIGITDMVSTNYLLDYEMKGYSVKKITLSFLQVNIFAILLALPFVVSAYRYYFSVWTNNSDAFLYEHPDNGVLPDVAYSMLAIVGFIIAMLICVILHEMIHGIVFCAFCHGKWKGNIHIGVLWDKLTPYCTCKKPLVAWGYLLAGIMPCIVLGFVPYVLAIHLGIREIMLLSVMNILCSGGDILIALLLMIHRPKYALDHPSQCGFIGIFAPKDKKRGMQ